MSRKTHLKGAKNSPKLQAVTGQQWHDLSQNPTLFSAYSQLSNALISAQSLAMQQASRSGGNADEYLDLSRAFSLLEATPQLIPYVQSLARESSVVPTDFLTKSSPTGTVNAQQSNDIGTWAGGKQGQVEGVPNSRILRDWADGNEWVRAAINIRRQQIGRANIAVMPFNERRTYNRTLAKNIQLLLDQPNEYRQNYYELMASAIDDLLVIDRGVLLKDMTVARKPVHLYNADGACIKIYPNWNGNPKEPRYLYESQSGTKKIPLLNDEVIMMVSNPATYRYSLSPVQVLRNTIQADLTAMKSASEMVAMRPPPHMIQLPGATQSQLEQIRARYETEIAGRKEVFWLGGQNAANVQKLVYSAKDNQWLEWQVYLARKIAVVFQISPQQLGITFDINKATASSQQEIFEDTGLIPLLLLVEEYFNRELLGDFAPMLPDGRMNLEALNLRILFPEVTEADRQMHAEKAIKMATSGLAGMPSMTLNQVLSMFGEEPVDGGNTFYVANKTLGFMPWLSYDNKTGDFGPASTGGEQGAQDPADGPDVDEDEPTDASGKSDVKPPTPAPTSAPSSSPAPPSAKKPQKGQSTLRRMQMERSFGKRWTPTGTSFHEL